MSKKINADSMEKLEKIYDLIIAAVRNEKRCDKLLLCFDVDLFLDFEVYCDRWGKQGEFEIEMNGMYCLVILPEKRVRLHYIVHEDANIYYPEEFYIAKIKEKMKYLEA